MSGSDAHADDHSGDAGGHETRVKPRNIVRGSQGSLRTVFLVFVGFAVVVLIAGFGWNIFQWAIYAREHGSTPFQQTAGANASAVSASDCSGKSKAISLGPNNKIINGGAECDMVGWDIDSPVVLVADNGYEETFVTAHAFGFRAARWRAANGHATVTAVFCPKGKTWNGVDACF